MKARSPFIDDEQAIKSTDLIHQGLGYVMESVKSAVANGTTIDPKSLIDYIANINDVVNTMKNHITRGVAVCSATSPFAAALCSAGTTPDGRALVLPAASASCARGPAALPLGPPAARSVPQPRMPPLL